MSAPFSIGTVGHFGLAVKDPRKSADWYIANLGVREEFTFESGVVVGSEGVTIVLFKGKPSPETIDHVSFHLPNRETLETALSYFKDRGVKMEDPGHEIGPEGPGSQNIGLWFYDPDGYRLELSVLAGARFAQKS